MWEPGSHSQQLKLVPQIEGKQRTHLRAGGFDAASRIHWFRPATLSLFKAR